MIELDFRTHFPIYFQIVDQIQRRIDAGELKPGDQLPTVRKLADELSVNFNTVARAYRRLDEAWTSPSLATNTVSLPWRVTMASLCTESTLRSGPIGMSRVTD